MCSKYGFRDEIINHHNFMEVQNNLKNKKLTKASSLVYNSEKVKKIDVDDFYANHKLIHSYKYYDAFLQTFSYLPNGCVVNNCFSMMYPKLHLYPAVRMVTNYNGRKITNHISNIFFFIDVQTGKNIFFFYQIY